MTRCYEYWHRLLVLQCRPRACCWLLPLRGGLMALAYINIVWAVLQVVGECGGGGVRPLGAGVQEAAGVEEAQAVCLTAPLADLPASAVLLAGLYRRDRVLLRAYVWYGCAAAAGAALVYLYVIALLPALYILAIALSLAYQIYMVLLVRSYIVELKFCSEENGFYFSKRGAGGAGVLAISGGVPAAGGCGGPLVTEPDAGRECSVRIEEETTPVVHRTSTLNKDGTLNIRAFFKKDDTLKRDGTLQKNGTLEKDGTLKKNDTLEKNVIPRKDGTLKINDALKKDVALKKDTTLKKDDSLKKGTKTSESATVATIAAPAAAASSAALGGGPEVRTDNITVQVHTESTRGAVSLNQPDIAVASTSTQPIIDGNTETSIRAESDSGERRKENDEKKEAPVKKRRGLFRRTNKDGGKGDASTISK